MPYPPLVVGAGPVGLGAALFLARHGVMPRVVETKAEPSPYSKALAVNPRTLDLLEPSGVTKQMLDRGLRIRGAKFHRGGKLVAGTGFDTLPARHPFMLALSQATTERLLAKAFADLGGTVERGVSLTTCTPAADGVEVTLTPAAGGAPEVARPPWVLAADGARSTARHALDIPFEGAAFAADWHLADAPLKSKLDQAAAHVALLPGGFLFLMRVVDDATPGDPAGPVWRVLSNRPDPLSLLSAVGAEPAGPPAWVSHFRVAHKIAATLGTGNVYLAGDAAHVHSPMGARGMNLGLEDAWVFAELARANRLAEYNALRRPVDRRVVRQVERVSRAAAGETRLLRAVRSLAFPWALKLPLVGRRVKATLTGLDHELPDVGPK